VEVDRGALRDTIEMVHREHRDHKPSMLVDVENGRRTEIESLNGAVVAAGERLGVPTPRVQTLLALIHAREADYL
jgi:2-dehydropantoate 2-reductase